MYRDFLNKYYSCISVVMIILLFPFASQQSMADERIALLIGNSEYEDVPLRNSQNDVRDMSTVLESFDFTVTSYVDADLKRMQRAIGEFSQKLGAGTVGFFYYAGHSMHVNGKNYLMPVDARIESENDVQWETLSLDTLLDNIKGAAGGLNLIVLDACRDSSYLDLARTLSCGVANAAPATADTMIIYATQPESVADDDGSENGVFTGELVRALRDAPELEIEELFQRVSDSVRVITEGRQSPWSEGSLPESFSFAVNAEPSVESASGIPQDSDNTLELSIWKEAVRGNTVAYYEAYLEQYPEGQASGIARIRIDELREAEQQADAAQPDKTTNEELTLAVTNSPEGQLSEDSEKSSVQVDQLIRLIEQDVQSFRLTSPTDNNANDKLNELERIDAAHPFLISEREKIRNLYGAWIDKQVAIGNFDKSRQYLQSMALVKGSEANVSQYGSVIDEAEKTAKRERKPASNPKRTASAESVADYTEECKKPGFFQRVSVSGAVTRRTRTNPKNGKDVPYGTARNINLNEGKFYTYMTLPTLAIKEYEFLIQVFDANGNRVVRDVRKIDNPEVINYRWTIWYGYVPKENDVAGEWTYMLCEGGYRQLVKTFTTYRG